MPLYCHFKPLFKSLSLLFIILLSACNSVNKSSGESLRLIPMPNSVTTRSGSLDVSKGFRLVVEELPSDMAFRLTDWLNGNPLVISDEGQPLRLHLSNEGNHIDNGSNESYTLTVNRKGVDISSPSEVGLFYALQSLLQLSRSGDRIPCVEINDQPRFAYRGLHIDVSRHFFSIDFLKKQIDAMAHYKLNMFHWHLTDAAGWRLQVDRYPELTGTAAWRPQASWKEWWASDRAYVTEGTPGAYGGYYTKEEVAELIRYAAERHVTIIPEIEMPGHSEEVLAVYPNLSCSGKPYTAGEFCIGNEETFEFLENVLDEVIELFPSKYIHVGGDEASKEHWKRCPKCQARIKGEGLKDEAGLQSYLIRRIEQYLYSKGRELIGWDEILEGGLDNSAVVMAWRGEGIGIEAARQGYRVIMTPGEYAYFDKYQGMPDKQPEAIGGFLPIEMVYSYNPVPDSFSPEEAARVWGVQANLWAEYIETEAHMEYMIWPRLLAMAEVAWTAPERKSWENFRQRVNREIPILQERGYNPYTLSEEPFISLSRDTVNSATAVTFTTERYPVEIRYTTDGSEPGMGSELYTAPIRVTDSTVVSARLFQADKPLGDVVSQRVDYHRAIGKEVLYNTPFSRYYPAGGAEALVDGLPGGQAHGDGRWQGFLVPELDVVVDMGKAVDISKLQVRFLHNANAWIWLPKTVTFSLSEDNEAYRSLVTLTHEVEEDGSGTLFQTFGWSGEAMGRFIRVQAPAIRERDAWLFMDEIVVW